MLGARCCTLQGRRGQIRWASTGTAEQGRAVLAQTSGRLQYCTFAAQRKGTTGSHPLRCGCLPTPKVRQKESTHLPSLSYPVHTSHITGERASGTNFCSPYFLTPLMPLRLTVASPEKNSAHLECLSEYSCPALRMSDGSKSNRIAAISFSDGEAGVEH